MTWCYSELYGWMSKDCKSDGSDRCEVLEDMDGQSESVSLKKGGSPKRKSMRSKETMRNVKHEAGA